MNKQLVKGRAIKAWRVVSITLIGAAAYSIGLPSMTLMELLAVGLLVVAVSALIEWIK